MTHVHTRRYVILLFAAILLLAPKTHAAVIIDRFDDNSINPTIWLKRTYKNLNIRETNQRLEVKSTGNTGSLSYAYLETRTWGINVKKNFTMSIDYMLNLPSPVGNNEFVLGFALSFEGGYKKRFNGLAVGISRIESGTYVVWTVLQEGEVVAGQAKKIAGSTGKLSIEWNRSADRMKVKAGGKTLNIYGLYETYGPQYGSRPLIVSVGGGAANGNMHPIHGSNAFVKNFVFNGSIRNR